jgi:hypothetical protein
MADFSTELASSFIPEMDVFTAFSPTRYFYAGCDGAALLIDIIQLGFFVLQQG